MATTKTRRHFTPEYNAEVVRFPLTEEVGAALLDYLRHARPHLPYREVFLRVRAPAGPIAPPR